jgi:hypothetical protein
VNRRSYQLISGYDAVGWTSLLKFQWTPVMKNASSEGSGDNSSTKPAATSRRRFHYHQVLSIQGFYAPNGAKHPALCYTSTLMLQYHRLVQ